jgi:hypothetical protein
MKIWSTRRALKSILLVMAGLATVISAGCVQSEQQLFSNTKPLMGESFEAHFFENFIDGKASVAHSAYYRWVENRYVIIRGSTDHVSSFTSVSLDNDSFVVEGTIRAKPEFNYWVARKVVDGVFLIVPVNEADADEATRAAACTGKKAEGFCFVGKQEDLIKLAKATASKALVNPTLGVLILRRDGA